MKLAIPENEAEFIPTRKTLLSRLKDRDDAKSWREFFDLYWRLIYSVARKAGLTETEAQEVVQETLITISKRIRDFKYDPKLGSFKGWLLNTTRWRISDQLRKRKRDEAILQHAETATGSTAAIERVPDPAHAEMNALWEDEWQKNMVHLAIQNVKQEVKPRQYQIFDLYVVKKWSVSKVASTLSVNAGQIYLAKHRVTSLIKKEVRNLQRRLV